MKCFTKLILVILLCLETVFYDSQDRQIVELLLLWRDLLVMNWDFGI